MSPKVRRVLARLFDWVAPRSCLGCPSELDHEGQWCPRCLEQLEENDVNILHGLPLIAPFRHGGPVREAVHSLKYSGRPDFARRMVQAGFACRPPVVRADTVLLPVPLHPDRLVTRGYNQAALVARALARFWGIRCECHGLWRSVATRPQVGRSRDERLDNVRGAFEARSGMTREIWLVDDVVTTGATTLACCEALRWAGAEIRGTIAFAHSRSSGSR